MCGEKSWPFDKAIADTICDLVAEGQNLHVIGKLDGMPPRWRIYEWFKEQPDFADNYARAREDRADWRSARIDNVVAKLLDGAIDPGAARVVIDAEKWQAGKEKPKVYGEYQRTEGKLETVNTNLDLSASDLDKLPDEKVRRMLAIMREESADE